MTDARNTNLITTWLSIEKSVVKSIIANATKFKLNVCIIDIAAPIDLKFRRNFSDYYLIEDDDGNLLPDIQMYKLNGLLN